MAGGWTSRGAPGIARARRARGRAVMAMPEVETSHAAASVMARDMASWGTFRISPDAALLPELETLGARSDDLARNNGIASGAERSFVDNVIGPRITCKPNPDRIALGKDTAWADEWSAKVESLYASFADSDWFDYGLRFNFHTATRLQARMIASQGEALALPMWTQRNGSRWNTCFQLVHPARLSNPLGISDSAVMRGGIEISPVTTEAMFYNIRKTHPGDVFGLQGLGLFGLGEWERIPAYQEFGRRRVVHVFDPERVGQTRGKSVVASVARLFNMFDKALTEQMRLAVLNSLIFAALETPLDQTQIADLFSGEDPEVTPMEAYRAQLDDWRITMKGGAMIPLPPGTKMTPFAPQQQMSGLDTFATLMLRAIGTGLNMPYEVVFRDFSKTNYSSARAALLEAWRYFASVRQYIIDHWCHVVYDLWFEEAVNRGFIPDCTPDDYYRNQVAWTRCEWIFAGRGWIDPFKEARAADMRLKSKITTLADECGEQGKDWRRQIEQDAREQDYQRQQYEARGLPWPPAQKAAIDPAAAAEQAAEDGAAAAGEE